MDKERKKRASSSRARATNVANMVTEHQIYGETKIKETKTIITENHVSTDNIKTVGKRTTGWLIVG